MGRPVFRRQSRFETGDPRRLAEQLEQFEERVEAVLRELWDRRMACEWRGILRTADSPVSLQVDQAAAFETNTGDITVVLPDATSCPGRKVEVMRIGQSTPTSNLLLTAISGRVEANTTHSLTTGRGLWIFESDGVDWWRSGS